MRKKFKKENRSFIDEWEIIRKTGFRNYIIRKTALLAVMMFFIYIINAFFCKDVNYLMVAIIYIVITIVAPIVAWIINEKRYKKYHE